MSSTGGAVLVTGATGSVGRYVVAGLVRAGEPVRAGTTRPGRDLAELAGAEQVRVDFEDPGSWEPAFAGVDRLFLMRPPQLTDTEHLVRPFIEVARRHDVRLVVFLSLLGVNRAMPHWRIERDLLASGLPHTFLRAGFFAQNLEAAYRDDIRDHDRIRLPAGQGRTSFVDTRDLADVAVLALRDPATHAGQAYDLTGPEAHTYGKVASLLSAELARPITYEPISFPRYWRALTAADLPRDYRVVQLAINAIARLGLAAKVTDDLPRLLGRPTRTLATYIHDAREAWARPGTVRA